MHLKLLQRQVVAEDNNHGPDNIKFNDNQLNPADYYQWLIKSFINIARIVLTYRQYQPGEGELLELN